MTPLPNGHKLWNEFYATDVPTVPETIKVLDVMVALRERLAQSEFKLNMLRQSFEQLSDDYSKLGERFNDLHGLIEVLRYELEAQKEKVQ